MLKGYVACAAAIIIPTFCIFANVLCILLYVVFGFVYIPYLLWMLIWDRNTSEQGGRDPSWARGFFLLRWFRDDYFGAYTKVDGEVTPKPKIYATFPHGIVTLGVWVNVLVYAQNDVRVATLRSNFFIPIFRELFLSMGFISANKKSIIHCLTKTRKSVMIMVGGAEEALKTSEGIILDKRRGFVEIALRTGCPLVPVYTFGERDVFHVYTPDASGYIAWVQKKIKQYTRCSFPIFWPIPRRISLVTVYGEEIPVAQKIEHPTSEHIQEYHAKFKESLLKLHEKHRHVYKEGPLKIIG